MQWQKSRQFPAQPRANQALPLMPQANYKSKSINNSNMKINLFGPEPIEPRRELSLKEITIGFMTTAIILLFLAIALALFTRQTKRIERSVQAQNQFAAKTSEILKNHKEGIEGLATSTAEVLMKQQLLIETIANAINAGKKPEIAIVSMYTSRPEETDSSPCISANNSDICALLKEGKNTCASNDLDFGTNIEIMGLGVCTIRDRMNSRYTGQNKIDWYAGDDLNGALEHGIKSYFIKKLPQ